jgi:hypothetical protein
MTDIALQTFELAPDDFRGLLRDALSRGVSLRFAAAGTSMDPFIKHGDVVTVAPLPARLSPGDIVAAVSPANGLVIIHRIVSLNEGEALLKGDNLPAADGWAAGAALLGRVARVERGGRPIVLGVEQGNGPIARLSRWNLLRVSVRIGAFVLSLRKQ